MARLMESKDLARAIRKHAAQHVEKRVPRLSKAVVTRAQPLAVELLGADAGDAIEDDHLLLGAWPRFYDVAFGIAVGDTLLLMPLDDGDWYVFDVLSQSDVVGGVDTHYAVGGYSRAALADGGIAQANVVATAPYHDPDTGNEIGVVLIFGV